MGNLGESDFDLFYFVFLLLESIFVGVNSLKEFFLLFLELFFVIIEFEFEFDVGSVFGFQLVFGLLVFNFEFFIL